MNDISAHDINPPTIKEALLDDGRIVEYDYCSRDKLALKGKKCRLLGRGTIYKINGLAQNDTAPKWFWSET